MVATAATSEVTVTSSPMSVFEMCSPCRSSLADAPTVAVSAPAQAEHAGEDHDHPRLLCSAQRRLRACRTLAPRRPRSCTYRGQNTAIVHADTLAIGAPGRSRCGRRAESAGDRNHADRGRRARLRES